MRDRRRFRSEQFALVGIADHVKGASVGRRGKLPHELNDVLAGMVAWGNMRTMARATGRVDRKNSTFQMTVVELGGRGRTAKVNGTIGGDGTATASIEVVGDQEGVAGSTQVKCSKRRQ